MLAAYLDIYNSSNNSFLSSFSPKKSYSFVLEDFKGISVLAKLKFQTLLYPGSDLL